MPALGSALLAALLFAAPGHPATSDETVYTGSGSIAVASQLDRPGSPGHDTDDAVPGGSTSGEAVAGLGPASSVAGPPAPAEGDSHRPTSPDSDHAFGITVQPVTGLYPGKRSRLQIVFHNPQPVAISVRTATVTATGPRACPLDTSLILRTRTFVHKVIVPAHGAKAKSLRFGMRKTATDGCQNAVFTLTVTATAVRA